MSDNEANPQQDVDYQFTMGGSGQVSGMQVVWGGHTYSLPLPGNATFAVAGDTVIKTLTTTDFTKVATFTQEAGSTTLYDRTDVTTTFNNPTVAEGGYSFTLNGSTVTAVQHVETENGQTLTETAHIPFDAVFSVGTGVITEQWVKGNEVDTVVYKQPTSGSDLYAVSSIETSYIDGGAATTVLDVNPKDRMEFTIDSSGQVTQPQHLDGAGVAHAINNPYVTFTQLAPGYVEKVLTHGSQTSYQVFYAGQSTNGVYTEVAHGSGSAVDLAGLQTQVAQAEHLLVTGATSSTATGWIV